MLAAASLHPWEVGQVVPYSSLALRPLYLPPTLHSQLRAQFPCGQEMRLSWPGTDLHKAGQKSRGHHHLVGLLALNQHTPACRPPCRLCYSQGVTSVLAEPPNHCPSEPAVCEQEAEVGS